MSSPEVHAKLSASGAKRWLGCTPSARMEESFSDRSSIYAEEGTAAHSLAEMKLKVETGKIKRPAFNIKYKRFKRENSYYNPAMDDYVDEYVSLVLEHFHALENPVIELEVKVDFSEWVPGGFGTSDVVITSDKVLEVIDLKYGKGIPVSAENNPQIMLYGLGAYAAYDMIYDFETVRMTIVQPRLGDISTFEISVTDLLEWANEYVKPRADLAESGKGDFFPSEDTCQWCKAKAVCKARAQKNLEIAQYEFQDPDMLSPKDIAQILGQSKEIENWLKAVKDYSLNNVRDHGLTIPGWKLVEGRSNRKIMDVDAVSILLDAEGFEADRIFKPKSLKGLTDLEKIVGKKHLTEVIGDYIVKPVGSPVLVAESDKRPALSSADVAAEDFEGIEIDE